MEKNIAYRGETAMTPYAEERCKLDLYLPRENTGFPVMVWFHGGGLESGSKDEQGRLADHFARHGKAR